MNKYCISATTALLLVFCCCERFGKDSDFLYRSQRGSNGIDSYLVAQELPPMFLDTTLLFCTVEVPKGADWRQDSAYYLQNGEVCLYENYKKILSFKSGKEERVSYSHDKHHIIGKDLYSEYSDTKGTTIKKNGKTLLEYRETEVLKGLLIQDGDLYSLGSDPVNNIVVFRKNGEAVLTINDAFVIGDFYNPGYPETGALYVDDSCLCFGFIVKENYLSNAHLVKDGVSRHIATDSKIYDIRSIGGRCYCLKTAKDGSVGWKSVSYYPNGVYVRHAGITAHNEAVAYSGGQKVGSLYNAMAEIYFYRESVLFVTSGIVGQYGDFFLTNSRCVSFNAAGTVYALSPRSGQVRPTIAFNEKVIELDFNGFFAAVKTTVKRSRSKDASRLP